MTDARSVGTAMQVWVGLCGALLLSVLLRRWLGPLAQDPAYHRFADTRELFGVIPRAGDVLTNLAILAAGLFGVVLRSRMVLASSERAAANLLIAGTLLMAIGSTYYHWDPSNKTLVWDRLPMMLTLMPVLTLVLADRVHPLLGRSALWPLTMYAAATVLFWAWSEAMRRGDLWPYAVTRFGAVLLVAILLVSRTPRYAHSAWMIAAVALQVLISLFERFDHEIFAATDGIASGHNLKHVTVGLSMACVFEWLRARRPVVAV